jgi:hypothetical protein
MTTLEKFEQKYKFAISEFESLYNKYLFSDLYDHLKNITRNYENNKNKFIETKNENSFNFLNYFLMYIEIEGQFKILILPSTI